MILHSLITVHFCMKYYVTIESIRLFRMPLNNLEFEKQYIILKMENILFQKNRNSNKTIIRN